MGLDVSSKGLRTIEVSAAQVADSGSAYPRQVVAVPLLLCLFIRQTAIICPWKSAILLNSTAFTNEELI